MIRLYMGNRGGIFEGNIPRWALRELVKNGSIKLPFRWDR